jgi:hypothetical protein
VGGDPFVVKVVNASMAVNTAIWEGEIAKLKMRRQTMQVISFDASRSVEDSTWGMALYFHATNPARLPNLKALAYPRVACLV